MSNKTLSFDANEVTTSAKQINYLAVTIETSYPEEIINEFSAEEIISDYNDLTELYEALKEHFDN